MRFSNSSPLTNHQQLFLQTTDIGGLLRKLMAILTLPPIVVGLSTLFLRLFATDTGTIRCFGASAVRNASD